MNTLTQTQPSVKIENIVRLESAVSSGERAHYIVTLRSGTRGKISCEIFTRIINAIKASGTHQLESTYCTGIGRAYNVVLKPEPKPLVNPYAPRAPRPLTPEQIERNRIRQARLLADIERQKQYRRNPITGHFLGGGRGENRR